MRPKSWEWKLTVLFSRRNPVGMFVITQVHTKLAKFPAMLFLWCRLIHCQSRTQHNHQPNSFPSDLPSITCHYSLQGVWTQIPCLEGSLAVAWKNGFPPKKNKVFFFQRNFASKSTKSVWKENPQKKFGPSGGSLYDNPDKEEDD